MTNGFSSFTVQLQVHGFHWSDNSTLGDSPSSCPNHDSIREPMTHCWFRVHKSISSKLRASRGQGPYMTTIFLGLITVLRTPGFLQMLNEWKGWAVGERYIQWNTNQQWLAGARGLLVAPEFPKWNIVWNLMKTSVSYRWWMSPTRSQPDVTTASPLRICLFRTHTDAHTDNITSDHFALLLSTGSSFPRMWSNLSAPSSPHLSPYRHLLSKSKKST